MIKGKGFIRIPALSYTVDETLSWWPKAFEPCALEVLNEMISEPWEDSSECCSLDSFIPVTPRAPKITQMLCQWLPSLQEDWSSCSRTFLSGLWDLCVPVLTSSPPTATPGLPLIVPFFLILNPGFSWGLPGPSWVFSWSHLLERPFLFFKKYNLFIYFWLCWVFVRVWASLAVE